MCTLFLMLVLCEDITALAASEGSLLFFSNTLQTQNIIDGYDLSSIYYCLLNSVRTALHIVNTR